MGRRPGGFVPSGTTRPVKPSRVCGAMGVAKVGNIRIMHLAGSGLEWCSRGIEHAHLETMPQMQGLS
jgi:hypothetical protein